MQKDQRIDAYIERQAAFAQPILIHLREAIHQACPQVAETIKWGMPAFLYRDKQLAGMAAFKEHATFGFWRGSELLEPRPGAMGQFGRLSSIADLPLPEELAGLIRQAMALTDAGTKPARNKTAKPDLEPPADFLAALADNQAAHSTFANFPPGCRREYVEWIVEAKRPETRAKRIAQAVEWMAEGKRRNWKYEQC